MSDALIAKVRAAIRDAIWPNDNEPGFWVAELDKAARDAIAVMEAHDAAIKAEVFEGIGER